jgi:hypothetical protein
VDVEARIRALEDGIFDPPLGGSLAVLDEFTGVTAAGYNDGQAVEVNTMPYHVGKSAECPSGKPHAVIKDSDGKVMGCHASEEDAHNQIAAIHANEGAGMTTPVPLAVGSPAMTGTGGYETADIAAMSGTAWEGVLVVEEVKTGDGRMFAARSVTWADMPLPLRRNIEDSHGGAPTTRTVLVGRIDQVYRNPENPLQIMGSGVFDDQGEHGAEAVRLVTGGFLSGVSVDPDDIADSDVELVFPEGEDDDAEDGGIFDALFMTPELTIFHAGRLRAATLVDIPAFVEAKIWLKTTEPAVAVAPTPAAATASGHFGALSDRQWNGPTHEGRLARQLSYRTARAAYAYVDGGPGRLDQVKTRFLHHEVAEDGQVGVANLTACSAVIRAINAGRAETLTSAERRAAYDHAAEHLRAAGLVPPPFELNEVIVASGADERPPAGWFGNPQLQHLTPLTVTDEVVGGWRRLFGHGADWTSCHTGFANVCRTPPREPNADHAYYRLGEVICAGGEHVAVGHITLGTGHAPTRDITASQAAEHYDNTGTVVALVASGEDERGIWVAGAIKPGVPDSRIVELQHSSLSGDWRRIGGRLRLVAFLAVNRPGFPIPRTSAWVAQNQQLSLVAAGIVTQDMRTFTRDEVGRHAAIERIARGIGRDKASRIAELKARVNGGVR